MKLKRAFLATVLGMSVLSFSTGASAAENDKVVDSSSISSGKVVTNPSKVFSMSASTPTNTSNTKTYSPIFGGSYAVSSSSSTVMEDYIYVRCRTFNGSDGSLIDSKSAESNNSSYVSAKANNGTFYFGNDWAIGNHIYKLEGYKDVVHETKAYW